MWPCDGDRMRPAGMRHGGGQESEASGCRAVCGVLLQMCGQEWRRVACCWRWDGRSPLPSTGASPSPSRPPDNKPVALPMQPTKKTLNEAFAREWMAYAEKEAAQGWAQLSSPSVVKSLERYMQALSSRKAKL